MPGNPTPIWDMGAVRRAKEVSHKMTTAIHELSVRDRTYEDTWVRRSKALSDMGFKSYVEFLASDYWAGVKAKARRRPHNRKCRTCGSTGPLEFHHRSYKMLGTKDELLNVIALCRKCHSRVHEVAADAGMSVRLATTHVVRETRPLRGLPEYVPFRDRLLPRMPKILRTDRPPNCAGDAKEIAAIIESCRTERGGFTGLFIEHFGVPRGPKFRLPAQWLKNLVWYGDAAEMRANLAKYQEAMPSLRRPGLE